MNDRRWLWRLLTAASVVLAAVPVAATPPVCTITLQAYGVCPGMQSAKNTASVPDAGAGATYSWTVTNGTLTNGAGTRSIYFSGGPSGTMGLSVTVTSPGGSSTCAASLPVIICQNGGTCVDGGYCYCTPNFSGPLCQNAIPTVTPTPTWTPPPPTSTPLPPPPTLTPTRVPTLPPTMTPTRTATPTATSRKPPK